MPLLTPKQLRKLRSTPVPNGGNRIARAMQLAGVTQAEIASALGMHQPSVSSAKRGRYRTMYLTTAQKLAAYFGCAVEDLFPMTEKVAS
jgi:transcriptional regulator with XRE-family HTH domain